MIAFSLVTMPWFQLLVFEQILSEISGNNTSFFQRTCNMADQPEFSNLTFAEIKKLKVAELKTRLSRLGLPVSG